MICARPCDVFHCLSLLLHLPIPVLLNIHPTSVVIIERCSRLSPVLISRWWLCDRGSDRPGQGHTVSGPEGHLSAWSQETIYTGRALSPLVIYRGGMRASFFFNPHGLLPCYFTCTCIRFNFIILCLLIFSQAASREVERDFNSVYSRLVLCKTYR